MSESSMLDRVLSVCAGIAAITAVAVALYQAKLSREQQRASAWPYVTQANWLPGTDAQYRRMLSNEGVGPARIRSFTIYVDSTPMKDWGQAVRKLTGEDEPKLVYSWLGRGSVVPAGASRNLLELPAGHRAVKFWSESQQRLRTVACYCSVYDECWISDSNDDDAKPVRACTDTNRAIRE